MKRAHYLQHVPFEGLGSIEPWLASAGYETTGTRLFDSPRFPNLDEVDVLVVMGGPMSVNDEDTLPWLGPEKQFVRQAVESGKTVLGVCLGAQLLASALGARVYPNRAKEIGWYPVHAVPSDPATTFRFPPVLDAFHWHGETFDLPEGAVHLARTEACEHQAFQVGRSVLGLQFHLEMTPASAADLVKHCRAELKPSASIQSEARILAAPPDAYRAMNARMADVLAYLAGAGSPDGRRPDDG